MTTTARILLLFFLSGSTSLVYEVVWMRRLSLVFGHSIFSVSTVLTTFMSGLALGSYLAGRWSDQQRANGRGPAELLRAYGKLELLIGAWALLSLALLNAVEAGFLALSRAGHQGPSLTVFLFLASFLVLLPPTTAMGATLPIFTQVLVMRRGDTGSLLSRIYGLNTLGACTGAAIGGLVGLPNLGLNLTVVATAAVNVLVTALAYSLTRQLGQPESEPAETEEKSEGEAAHEGSSGLVPLVFGLSGFAGMVYQLGWTRALVLSIGSSTYSFSIILTSFLASLGAGSVLYRRLFSHRQPRVRDLSLLQFFIALTALLVTAGMGYLPRLKIASFSLLERSFSKVVAFDTLAVLLLLLLPTLALGLTFPLVTHLLFSPRRAGAATRRGLRGQHRRGDPRLFSGRIRPAALARSREHDPDRSRAEPSGRLATAALSDLSNFRSATTGICHGASHPCAHVSCPVVGPRVDEFRRRNRIPESHPPPQRDLL